MNNLWAIGSSEEVYAEIKVDRTVWYIPLFRTPEDAKAFVVERSLPADFEPRSFQFGPYDYMWSLSKKQGHTLYLKIMDREKQ